MTSALTGPETTAGEATKATDHSPGGQPGWAGGPPWGRGWHGHRWEHGGTDGPWHWRRRRLSLVLPVVVGLIQVWGCWVAQTGPGAMRAPDDLAWALLLIGPAALIWRRISPLTTLVVALAATYGYLVLDYPRGPYFVAAFIALVTAASRSNRVAVWTITAVSLVPVVFATVWGRTGTGPVLADHPMGITGTEAAFALGWTVFALLIGEAVRAQRERFAEHHRARAEAGRARTEQTRRQASDERLRIARELHDVLGHHLSLINVRAGVALHLLDSQPAQAREALGAIKLASAEALREVRSVLATLTPQDDAAPRTPAPGLAGLDDLAAEAEAAGTPVHIVRTGTQRAVPGEVERAAYRIVRESLTNVRRHAGPGAMVTVSLGYAADGLAVRVEDTGVGPVPSPPDDADTVRRPGASQRGTSEERTGPNLSNLPGNGIAGMRERAAALGGRLYTGPGTGGVGFVVEAFLPTPAEEPEPASAPASEPASGGNMTA